MMRRLKVQGHPKWLWRGEAEEGVSLGRRHKGTEASQLTLSGLNILEVRVSIFSRVHDRLAPRRHGQSAEQTDNGIFLPAAAVLTEN